ncbi:hypothetical protein H6G93_05325 [Nostoc sp. FACHB-973]|nr:hypothetical protein [Nostoc sp. FACHB-973]
MVSSLYLVAELIGDRFSIKLVNKLTILPFRKNLWPQRSGDVAALSGGYARAEEKSSFCNWVLVLFRPANLYKNY